MKKEDDKMEALVWSCEMVSSDNLIESEDKSYEALYEKLANYLNHLMATDFNKLVDILYRIDISQEKAIVALAENAQEETSGQTLARLVIERQLEKVITRRKNRNP